MAAVQELNAADKQYLLDGHFCLLNADRQVTRIPPEIFAALRPDAIVLLREKPNIIAERRKQRDGIDDNAKDICRFQGGEISYAREVAEALGVPIRISDGMDDFNTTFDFVQQP